VFKDSYTNRYNDSLCICSSGVINREIQLVTTLYFNKHKGLPCSGWTYCSHNKNYFWNIQTPNDCV
jgi:hypothetical protein